MLIHIPDFSLVLLLGPPGSGQDTFIEEHIPPSMVLSLDEESRGSEPEASPQRSIVLPSRRPIILADVADRLRHRLRTVVKVRSLNADARKPLAELARRYHARLVAIVFDFQAEESQGPSFSSSQIRNLNHEGFHEIYTLRSAQDLSKVHLGWVPAASDKRDYPGPFDVIGDVHGCADELFELLHRLGYQIHNDPAKGPEASHPEGRRLIFVGDLVDRGPAIVKVLQLLVNSAKSGQAFCVIGNHENKLLRYLAGRKVKISHGLEKTIEQLEDAPDSLLQELPPLLHSLSDHLILDEERLVVAHAGIREDFIGRSSGEIRAFCLYGETNGELDEYGLPVRLPWARKYQGTSLVVYGHTPVAHAEWIGNTVNIDTGCVYGGALSALRYPERSIVSVAAKETYYEPRRPFKEKSLSKNRGKDRTAPSTVSE